MCILLVLPVHDMIRAEKLQVRSVPFVFHWKATLRSADQPVPLTGSLINTHTCLFFFFSNQQKNHITTTPTVNTKSSSVLSHDGRPAVEYESVASSVPCWLSAGQTRSVNEQLTRWSQLAPVFGPCCLVRLASSSSSSMILSWETE